MSLSFGLLEPNIVRGLKVVDLVKLMRLAGFFTAHAVWTLSTRRGGLTPILVTETAGERSLTRFDQGETMPEAVARAQELLESNAAAAERGILFYDAFVNLDEGRTDAVIIQGQEQGPQARKIEIIQPYWPAKNPKGFAVMQPKVSFNESNVDDAEGLIEAFFEGIDTHEEGAPLWADSVLAAG